LLYGSESCTIKARDMNRIQSVEIRYLKTDKGHTRAGYIKTEDIRNIKVKGKVVLVLN
jgi:hypothetical protein